MAVFRVHKTSNYTTMSNQHLRDADLTLKAKGLMSVMLSLPEDWDYNAKGLATLSLGGEAAVKSALKELEEHKYLKRTAIREKGVIRDWQYDIYENPESLENTASEPEVEKPLVAKPLVEKQPQINTNILNKEEINKEKINSNSTKVELEQPTVTQSNTPKRLITVVPATLPIKEKKKSLYEKCQDKIDDFTKDEKIKELLTTYLKVRLEIKDYPLYANQWTGYINELKRLVESGQDMREVIQQSINRGYRGFFPVKKYNKQSNGQDPVVFSEYGIVKSVPAEGEAMHVQF